MTFFDTPPSYQTFLVTLWEERSQDRNKPKVWRFRLEVPRTGEQYGFATFEELVAFLEDQMDGEGGLGLSQAEHVHRVSDFFRPVLRANSY